MLEITANVDTEAIIRAKRFYERKRKGPKPKFEFETLYQKFCNPNLSFKKIARQLGCSHSHVSYLFNFFREIVPEQLRNPQKRAEREWIENQKAHIDGLIKLDTDSAAAVFTALARQKKIRAQRIYSYWSVLKRYVKVKNQLCYVARNRNPRRARSEFFRRYFMFPLHKEVVGSAKFIVLIAESQFRQDTYIFKAEDLMNFQGMSKQLYIPDITTPPLKDVKPSQDQLLIEPARNNWDLFRTAE